MRKHLLVLGFLAFCAPAVATVVPSLASFSFQAVATWTTTYFSPAIASGTALPATGTVGDLFHLVDTSSGTAILYRYTGTSWYGPATATGIGDATSLQGTGVGVGAPASGQVLTFNGTSGEWEPIDAAATGDATSIQGTAVGAAAPASGQVLTFNGDTSEWEPINSTSSEALQTHIDTTTNPHGPDMELDGRLSVGTGFQLQGGGIWVLLSDGIADNASDGAVVVASFADLGGGDAACVILAPASCTYALGVASGSFGYTNDVFVIIGGRATFNLESTANASPGSVLITSDTEIGTVEPASDPPTEEELERRIGIAVEFGSGDGGTVVGIVGR